MFCTLTYCSLLLGILFKSYPWDTLTHLVHVWPSRIHGRVAKVLSEQYPCLVQEPRVSLVCASAAPKASSTSKLKCITSMYIDVTEKLMLLMDRIAWANAVIVSDHLKHWISCHQKKYPERDCFWVASVIGLIWHGNQHPWSRSPLVFLS